MDHSPSIITQVTKDEEENATCREEGEFGKSFVNFSAAHDTVSEARDRGVTRRHGVTNATVERKKEL